MLTSAISRHKIKDAIAFIQTHGADLTRLMSEPSACGVLDFAVDWRDVSAQFDNFPAALVREAGRLGLALELSRYPISEEPGAEA
jgi:hypothetical protein